MKKLWERLKEAWYGALPILLIVGIPLAVATAVWLVINWNDIPKILGNITDIGNGSLLYGVFLILFGLIGLINAFAAFMMWFKKFTEWLEKLDRKGKPRFLLWVIIIVVSLGWYALFKLIKLF